MSHNKIKIVITSGEPAGIGADICLDLPVLDKNIELYVIVDPELIAERADKLNINRQLVIHHDLDNLSEYFQADKLNIIPLSLNNHSVPGKLDVSNSNYVLDMLNIAHDLCTRKIVDAMVTGPLQKSIINDAGYEFTGHTEYLAEKSNCTPVMMLATSTLRVALATTHLPLKDVSLAITKTTLTDTIKILDQFLQEKARIQNPEILICGLNPHAGEDGNLGNEEIDTIIPVIEALKKQGLNLIGPLPADTLFTPRHLESADAVLAMYHDQGLPVLKYCGFGKAVNITLGIPFIRTSVDHGTALDLAGTGEASSSSLHEAIKMAIKYCEK